MAYALNNPLCLRNTFTSLQLAYVFGRLRWWDGVSLYGSSCSRFPTRQATCDRQIFKKHAFEPVICTASITPLYCVRRNCDTTSARRVVGNVNVTCTTPTLARGGNRRDLIRLKRRSQLRSHHCVQRRRRDQAWEGGEGNRKSK